MISTSVLKLPNFDQLFLIKTDTSGMGMGAVLMQEGYPIAYISKPLSIKHQGLSTYEKELMAFVMVVMKWRYYLIGSHFIIRTDHQALKFLLEQKLTTNLQYKWLTKLLGLDYETQFKKRIENKVVDALSRRNEDLHDSSQPNTIMAITSIQHKWI